MPRLDSKDCANRSLEHSKLQTARAVGRRGMYGRRKDVGGRAVGLLCTLSLVYAALGDGSRLHFQLLHRQTHIHSKHRTLHLPGQGLRPAAQAAYTPELSLEECGRRVAEPPETEAEAQGLVGELGVVISVCEWDFRVLHDIGCRGGRIRYYIYNTCQHMGGKLTKKRLAPVEGCVASIKTAYNMIYSEMSQTDGHAEFLTHIISSYEELDEKLLFVTAHDMDALHDAGRLSQVLDQALSGEWAFKSTNLFKTPLAFDRTPIAGNVARYGRELCTLYRRFTCEAECHSCWWAGNVTDEEDRILNHNDGPETCAFVSTGTAFMTTSQRVRSIVQADYHWLRVWMQSWQEDEQGALRKQVANRLWPLVLGCPLDLRDQSPEGGCLVKDAGFSTSGQRIKPPQELIDDGLVFFPPPTFRHDNGHPYPRIVSPKYRYSRDITFVVAFGHHIPGSSNLDMCFRSLFGTILYYHPSATVVVLVRSELYHNFLATVRMKWYANRLQLVEIETKNEVGYLGVLHSDFDGEAQVKEWKRMNWMQVHVFEMRQQYLRMLADRQIRWERGDSPDGTHHVFLNLNHFMLQDMWPVFDSEEPFAMALSIQPLDHHAVDSSAMFVHKDHIVEAAALLDNVLNTHLLRGGFRGSMDQVIHQRLLKCLPGDWWKDPTTRVVSCSDDKSKGIKLLPASVWNGMIVKGPVSPPAWLRREWAASAASHDARLVQIMLQRGAPSLPNEQYQMFKVTRERFDLQERRRQAFKNANMTYHVDEDARTAALLEAAEGRLAGLSHLPETPQLFRLQRHPVVLTHAAAHHRQLEGQDIREEEMARSIQRVRERELMEELPRASAQSLKYPNLLSTNPEEERYDFDDPFMYYMYEIMRPEQPTPETFKTKKAAPEPEFSRSLKNRQYMDELMKKYSENYLHLLKRPSPARFVVEEWGGQRSAFPEPSALSAQVEEKLRDLHRATGEFGGSWEDRDEASDSEDDGLLPGEEHFARGAPAANGVVRSVGQWLASHLFRKASHGRILV